MGTRVQSLVALLARLLLCVIFLTSAFGKITGYAATLEYMEARGMPAVQLGLPVAIAAEVAGGLALLVGLRARLGALLLIAFLVPATLYFHNFWTFPADQVRNQMAHFLKNTAIVGGLLMVVAFGAGGWAVDARRAARRTKRSGPEAG